MKYTATVEDRDFEVDIDRSGEVVVDGVAHAVDLRPIDGTSLFSLIIDNESHELLVERREGMYYVYLAGNRLAVDVGDARLKALIAMSRKKAGETSGATVFAPMPGLVVKVLVEPGAVVSEGDGLVILEAMKMENEIRSPSDGVVRLVSATAGSAVNIGDVLVIIDASTDGLGDVAVEGSADGSAQEAGGTSTAPNGSAGKASP